MHFADTKHLTAAARKSNQGQKGENSGNEWQMSTLTA